VRRERYQQYGDGNRFAGAADDDRGCATGDYVGGERSRGNGIAPGGLATLTDRAWLRQSTSLASSRCLTMPVELPWPWMACNVLWPTPTPGKSRFRFLTRCNRRRFADRQFACGVSAVYPLAVSAAAPGILYLGWVRAIAANTDGTLNSPDNPAAVNSTIQVGLTGIGLLRLPIADGQGAPASPALVPALAGVRRRLGEWRPRCNRWRWLRGWWGSRKLRS